MPRKKQTKRTKRAKPKQSNNTERAQQKDSSDTENSQSTKLQNSEPDAAKQNKAGRSESPQSATRPFPNEPIAGPSKSQQNNESLKGARSGEPCSSSEPPSSTYYATGPSTSSSAASISFPQVYHFLGPSTSSSAAASPVVRRRIFYLGGSSTPSISFSPDIGRSSLEDLVAAAEEQLVLLRRQEAARLLVEGHSSSEDFHNRIQMPVGERFKAFWCIRDWDNHYLWRFHEVYMLLLVLVGPTSIMTLAYSLICWEVWRVMERRSIMTSQNVLSRNHTEESKHMESIKLTALAKVKQKTRTNKDDTRMVKQVIYMLVAVVVLFAICWGPLLIDNLLTAYNVLPKQRTGNLKYMATAFHLMAYFNSCINPIIYGFMSKSFRESFQSALCCTKSSTGHANDTRVVSSFRQISRTGSQTRTTSMR